MTIRFDRVPFVGWLLILAAALFTLSCERYAYAGEPGGVTTSLLGWKLVVLDHDGTAYRKGGDLFGGRVISSMDLKGGLHLGLRGDATALTADDVKNPALWRSVESYLALSRPFPIGGGFTAGPAVMAGTLMPITTEASWSSRATFGGGLRVSRGRSWAYAMAGPNGAADERAPNAGHPVRFLGAAQVELGRVALLGDYVSGPGGFARGGLGFRVPVPWGAK